MVLAALNRLFSRQAPRPPHAAYQDHLVKVVGNTITQGKGFDDRVPGAVEQAWVYLDRQVQAIPGPFPIAADAHGNDAFAQAIFPAQADIRAALGRSLAAKDALQRLDAGQSDVYALMGMRLRSPGNGAADVFADHTIRSLATTEEACRDQLRFAAFARLVVQFNEHVDKLKRAGRMLASEWNTDLPPGAPVEANAYVTAVRELAPDNMVKGLLAWLGSPEKFLRLELGKVPVCAMELPLMHCFDRRHWAVCLLRLPITELAAAIREEARAHRYIFI